MSDLSNIKRSPLAADTEPTDEELGDVMREARDLAMERKQQSDSWIRRMLAEAVADARARDVVAAA
jgi:hypothetical protein